MDCEVDKILFALKTPFTLDRFVTPRMRIYLGDNVDVEVGAGL